MTKQEIVAIYKAEIAQLTADARNDRASLALHAWRGTRTRVHAALELQSPQPYNAHPDHLLGPDGKELGHVIDPTRHSGKRAFTRREADQIVAHKKSFVTEEQHKAFEVAQATAKPTQNIHTRPVDAHHFVQREHGIALWAKTDKLVADAGITEKGLVQ